MKDLQQEADSSALNDGISSNHGRRVVLVVIGLLVVACLTYVGYRQVKYESVRHLHDTESFLNIGDIDSAIASLRLHVLAHPNDMASRMKLARLYEHTGKVDYAERTYQRVYEKSDNGTKKEAGYELGMISYEQADEHLSRKEWAAAADKYMTAGFYFEAIDDSTAAGECFYNRFVAEYNGGKYKDARWSLNYLRGNYPAYEREKVDRALMDLDDLLKGKGEEGQ